MRDSPARGLVLGGGALAVAVGDLVVLDVVAPGAGPLTQPLSSYAHTGYAWLWRLAVLSGALGVALLARGPVGRAAVPSVRPALLSAAAGLAAAGLCATDPWFPWERTPTGVGALHLTAVVLVAAAFARATARGTRATWARPWAVARTASRAARVTYRWAVSVSRRRRRRLENPADVVWNRVAVVFGMRRARRPSRRPGARARARPRQVARRLTDRPPRPAGRA
ncbi:hypothetical protein tb265_46290 [Gemmatimonadetes bacterium T265]|nr:hypothetical protein tb265_46290 [Gemmatimonadetes bacterium T265]